MKKNKKRSMWKSYTQQTRKQMNKETTKLSTFAARYEVYYNIDGVVTIKVRCRKNSRVYNLCKSLGYEWS